MGWSGLGGGWHRIGLVQTDKRRKGDLAHGIGSDWTDGCGATCTGIDETTSGKNHVCKYFLRISARFVSRERAELKKAARGVQRHRVSTKALRVRVKDFDHTLVPGKEYSLETAIACGRESTPRAVVAAADGAAERRWERWRTGGGGGRRVAMPVRKLSAMSHMKSASVARSIP